jgi:hypothetical protein
MIWTTLTIAVSEVTNTDTAARFVETTETIPGVKP